MGAAVNFKLLWFLILILLTQAHIIHKRQTDKDNQSQSLVSFRPVQELLIKARQALNNDFNDLVSPPYDDVNLKVELSENKTKKDFAILTKIESKMEKNFGNSYFENKEKLLKIGNSESEETLKSNSENKVTTSGPSDNHLIKSELSFADDNVENSSNTEFSENKGILKAQSVASKTSENFLKEESDNSESNVNKNQISAIKNSENSSTLKQNSNSENNLVMETQNTANNLDMETQKKQLEAANSENNLDMETQKQQLEAANSENKLDMETQKKQLEATNNDDEKSGSYGEIKNKNSLENSENQLQAANNSEKELIHLNTKKEDKQAENLLNKQKPNENGSVPKPEALKEPSKVSEIENTTETLPLYTPAPVTALPDVVLKKKPLPGNSTKPPLRKPNTTAIPSKPDKTTATFSSTIPTAIRDEKATEKPIIMSATQPTRRPILAFPTRRPTPQRPRPPLGLRPPAWFTNLPLLPLNPLLPNFFINPLNTSTTSTTNQPQNNVGFGIFAIPWTWRPFNNITGFFSPNRILETRPPSQEDSETTAETRDLAFWNALFHRDYKAPGNAIYKDSSEAHKTSENVNDSYWKPWKFLKFFSDNGDTNDVATVPANTQILHVYFPLKYPFKGKIVQTPAYQMEEESPANNEEVFVKDGINPADESIKERALDATTHKSGDTADIASKKKDDKKSSLMFELEMPKPVVQLFQGFMETFMPQQN